MFHYPHPQLESFMVCNPTIKIRLQVKLASLSLPRRALLCGTLSNALFRLRKTIHTL